METEQTDGKWNTEDCFLEIRYLMFRNICQVIQSGIEAGLMIAERGLTFYDTILS